MSRLTFINMGRDAVMVLLPSLLLLVMFAASAGSEMVLYTASNTDWQTASDTCTTNGSRLLIIPDEQMSDSVLEISNTGASTYIWIGLKNEAPGTGESYTWVDGVAMSYSNWASTIFNEPDNADTEKCIALGKFTNEWYTKPCTSVYSFLCENDTSTTTVETTNQPTTIETTLLPTTMDTTTKPTTMETTTKPTTMETTTQPTTVTTFESSDQMTGESTTDISCPTTQNIPGPQTMAESEMPSTVSTPNNIRPTTTKLPDVPTPSKTTTPEQKPNPPTAKTTELVLPADMTISDLRTSARAIGILGIVMVGSMLALILVMDLTSLRSHLGLLKRNLAHFWDRDKYETSC